MAAALAYDYARTRAELVFQTQPGTYNEESLISFLTELHDYLAGAKVTLIWDGLPSHRSKKMRAFILASRRWLVVERLPAYAPELNPVEGLWASLKGSELANLEADTIEQTACVTQSGVSRIRADTNLCFGFLGQTGLSL